MSKKWVMDYETLSTCFVGVFIEATTLEKKIFVMSRFSNDYPEFISFLVDNKDNGDWHVSFNGHNFDAQITEAFLSNQFELYSKTGLEIAQFAYSIAQTTINTTRNNQFLPYSIYNFRIKQLDLFRLKHYNSPAKNASLKWIQFSMDWDKLLDMPIHHTTDITNPDDINKIIEYCINDVMSTRELMFKSKEDIKLRAILSKEYDLNLYSASEPGIAKEIFLKLLSESTGIKSYELRKMRTYRTNIKVSEVILPQVNFKTFPFQLLLKKYKEQNLDPENTKGGFKYSTRYKGLEIEYGLGGVHGALPGSIIESDNDLIIMSLDVKSFYPNLIIKNNWAPAHIDKRVFCELYSWFYSERTKLSKKDPKNYVYKIILNSTYGLSNDKHSFLLDSFLTMQVTINGQLLLTQLVEELCENIPNSKPVMINTKLYWCCKTSLYAGNS